MCNNCRQPVAVPVEDFVPTTRIAIYGKTADNDPANMLLHNECVIAAQSAAFQIEQTSPEVSVTLIDKPMRVRDARQFALNDGAQVFFYLSVRRVNQQLQHWGKRRYVNIHFAIGDTSMWSVFLAHEFERQGLYPYQHVNDNQLDRELVKRGCIPINITMGNFHSSDDLRYIYQYNIPIVTQAIAKAVKYMNTPGTQLPPDQRLNLFTLGGHYNGNYNPSNAHARQAFAQSDIR